MRDQTRFSFAFPIGSILSTMIDQTMTPITRSKDAMEGINRYINVNAYALCNMRKLA